MYSQFSTIFDQIWEKHTTQDVKANIFEDKFDTTKDCSWSLASLGTNLENAITEIRSIVAQEETKLIRTGQPFLSYGSVSPMANATPEAYRNCWKVLTAIKNNHRRKCFFGTRVEATMKKVIKDFKSRERTKAQVSFTLEFTKYPSIVKKGNEFKEALRKYNLMGITNPDEVKTRAIRDFFFSAYLFQHLRNFNIEDLSICASVLCLTTCVDFVNQKDDPMTGSEPSYIQAMLDGFTLYKGAEFASVIDNIVMGTSFICYKNETSSASEPIYSSMKRIPSPSEFMEARWWDGSVGQYFQIALLCAKEASVPVDYTYAPIGTKICTKIRKAIDLLVRYNEILDINSDVFVDEVFNEFLIAGRYGGLKAVVGYASACAACVEDVAKCNCIAGDTTHDYATDLAIGCGAWYAIVPRYRALTQLSECAHKTNENYRKLLQESNHAAFITSKFAITVGDACQLHNEDWTPAFKFSKVESLSDECGHCKCITNWLVHRCMYRDEMDTRVDDIRKFVKIHFHNNNSNTMENIWKELFQILGKDECFTREFVNECAAVVEGIWKLSRAAADQSLTAYELIDPVVDMHTIADKTLIRSFKIPNGHTLRKGLIGLISLIFERTDIAVYQRLEETAIIHSTHD